MPTAACRAERLERLWKNKQSSHFDHFTFQYYSQAEPTLHDINLKIYPGEKILIVGPSGSGKSTLYTCINGLIPFAYKARSAAA
jgi:energy-coupling factor transport system ATP-binding protein